MKRLLGVAVVFLCLTSAVRADVDVDELVKQLKDKDVDVRRKAAKDLADAGAEAKPAVAALTSALMKDNDLFVRRFAAQALGSVGNDAKDAIPSLEKVIKNPKERKEVQEAAVTAVSKIGKGGVTLLGAVVADTDFDITVRRMAAEGLGSMGADAKDALPALVDAVKGVVPKGKKADNTNDIRLEAASALGEIATPKDKDALEALKKMNADKGAKKNKPLFDAVNAAVKKIEARN
jgi:HEAT repeat protein